jgi:integrase
VKRRGNGEGSIVERANGTWAAAISLGWIEGKRARKFIYGRTRKEVADKLHAQLHEKGRGLPVRTKDQTLENYLTRWLEFTKPAVRPRTWEKFESVVRIHLIPNLGTYRLEKLQPEHVQMLLTRKLTSGLSPQSVKHIRTILSIALNRAMKWNLIGRNVAALTDPPKFDRAQVVPLTLDEVARLRRAASEDRLEALLELELSVGLRRGEALALRWADLDPNNVLTISQSLQRVDGKLQLLALKTDSSRRRAELSEIAIKALRKHESRQKEQRLKAGAAWKETDLIFCTAIGLPLEPRNIVRSFKSLLKKAGIQDKRFHDLRHTFASLALSDGAPVKDVSAVLGHARASMTLDVYSHLMPGSAGRVASRMDKILGAL